MSDTPYLDRLRGGEETRLTADEEALLLADLSDPTLLDLAEVVALGKLERVPGKQNWVDHVGGLPKYIEDIAHALHTKRGMTISRAIATAVNRVKKWAAGGDNVNADTRAKAAKAVAQWEAKKAKAKVRRVAKAAKSD